MDIDAIKAKAKRLDDQTQAEMAQPYFQNVMAWFVYLGLLRHNNIKGRRVRVTLTAVLRAGAIEPRILEVLPALLVRAPDAVKFNRRDIPRDLAEVLAAIKRRNATVEFRGVAAHKYLHWLTSPAFETVLRRLHFRALPRVRPGKTSELAEIVSQCRIARELTQKQLADSYGLSLRVIRDIEQGKLTASFQNVTDVVSALGRKVTISPV
jgi:hypothetical protein